jgi:uncharacterized glyoxalase superfamily protein PhnB
MPELLSLRPNLEVTDLEPLATHLRQVFEFEVDVEEPEMGLVMLHRGEVSVAVVRTANPGVNETTSGYVGVTEVDAFHDACVARGAKVIMGLEDHPWGLRDFVAELPGGHRLAFGQRI